MREVRALKSTSTVGADSMVIDDRQIPYNPTTVVVILEHPRQ